MDNIRTIAVENRHISSSLMEKILSERDNSLVQKFFKVYKTEATGKGIKNVTINSKGEMTFLPKGKECVLNTSSTPEVWKTDNRQAGNYGKVLRKLLVENGVDPNSIIAKELENIVNSLKARYTVEGEFAVVSGRDITHYYLGDNYDYDFNLGSLGNSCMRYDGACQDATDFYAGNDNCKMVVLKSPDSEKARGRALLWTDVEGNKYMDRIYANDHIIEAFKNYAKTNGWYHKSSQNSSNGAWVSPKGDTLDISVNIEVDTEYSLKPYMDTFYFWEDNKIMNHDDNGYDIVAQNEPIYDDDEGRVYDDVDDCYIDEDDAVYISDRGVTTSFHNAFSCSIDGDWYLLEDMVECEGDSVNKDADGITWVESENSYYYDENVTHCDYNDQDYPSSEVRFIPELEIDVHEDSVEDAYEDAGWHLTVDGDWVKLQKELF